MGVISNAFRRLEEDLKKKKLLLKSKSVLSCGAGYGGLHGLSM